MVMAVKLRWEENAHLLYRYSFSLYLRFSGEFTTKKRLSTEYRQNLQPDKGGQCFAVYTPMSAGLVGLLQTYNCYSNLGCYFTY